MKWLVFDGKAENYPACSTKFTACMQTKGLCKALLRKEYERECTRQNSTVSRGCLKIAEGRTEGKSRTKKQTGRRN